MKQMRDYLLSFLDYPLFKAQRNANSATMAKPIKFFGTKPLRRFACSRASFGE